MRQAIVTLTTDFGLADHFVGAMKGVILSLAPKARIVDITHQVAPFAISEAAFVVAEAARWFPAGTVHMVVVDPGVGTPRRALVAEAGGHYFVAPDKGVLSLVLARGKPKVREITADRYFLHPVSRTFHGRDIFAPVAARLASGAAPSRFGVQISEYERGAFATPSSRGGRAWRGTVLKTDRFGNLITNFQAASIPEGRISVRVGRHSITRRVQTYAEGKPGELLLIAGSSGYLEVSVNQGSAAAMTGAAAGAEVNLTVGAKRSAGRCSPPGRPA